MRLVQITPTPGMKQTVVSAEGKDRELKFKLLWQN